NSMGAVLQTLHADHQASARNLLHYVGLRRHDIRALQVELSALGLSSLGRSEACLLTTLERVVTTLAQLAEQAPPKLAERPVRFDEGRTILTRNTAALFGPEQTGRPVRIMVTMSSEAAHSYDHVRSLIASGMDCMRINCAHDDATAWARMIEHLRRA